MRYSLFIYIQFYFEKVFKQCRKVECCITLYKKLSAVNKANFFCMDFFQLLLENFMPNITFFYLISFKIVSVICFRFFREILKLRELNTLYKL